jgi:hypothetical protein
MRGSFVYVTAIAAVAHGLWHHRMMFETKHCVPSLFCTQAESLSPPRHISHVCNQSSATVIVSPHGGIASNVLFSNDGAAALLLVDAFTNSAFVFVQATILKAALQVGPGDAQRRGAKDTHIYPWLTWLTVRYWVGTGSQVLHQHCKCMQLLPYCRTILFQDQIHDLVLHIILLAERVERSLAVQITGL